MTGKPIPVDVISDVMCPWCYIGKRRLEQAARACDGTALAVRWRPYQLDATIPADGMDRQEYLSRKFGSAERADEIYAPIRSAGQLERIPFAFDKIKRSPNTLDAHRLIRWSEAEGVQDAVVERLFQVYFLEGGDLTDHEVLAKVAEDAGMDPAVVLRLLQGEADKEETAAEIASARQMGVTGVPTFIIGNRLAVVGAQGADILAGAINKISEQIIV